MKGVPYYRNGPSLFIKDFNMIIDLPEDITNSLNREDIHKIDRVLLTHVDPDHINGIRVIELLCGDPVRRRAKKEIELIAPIKVLERLRRINTQYGPYLDFYEQKGYIRVRELNSRIKIQNNIITPIYVKNNAAEPYMYSISTPTNKDILIAPCDIKPFPFSEVKNGYDLVITQPGIINVDLDDEHPLSKELYAFEDTLDILKQIGTKKTIFMHLEEYWQLSYDDYRRIENQHKDKNIHFAYDGMVIKI